MVFRLPRKPVVVVYVRHRDECPHAFTKVVNPRTKQPKRDESYPKCDCPKGLRYSLNGKQKRVPAHTRTWGLAEEKAQELQRRLDAGAAPLAQAAAAPSARPTIAASIQTFITGKEGEGTGHSTIRKLRYQLGCFEKFMADRSKLFPSEVTPTDVIEYRASWSTWSDLTRIKAQQNLRGLLRFCCDKDNRDDILAALKTIKETKAGKERREPKPFTEPELKRLLAQIPKTFPEPTKAERVTALVHCMVSTGLAIRDTIQLERENINGGWLRIKRQKTGRKVQQKLDGPLHKELLAVTNGNPKYVFWSGVGLPTSATTNWQNELKRLMEDAGVWIKGNVSHRFRDTAADFWLGAGCSMTEVASMLGDSVAIVEKHYADLASKRMEERLSKIPVRTW
jgi:integrase